MNRHYMKMAAPARLAAECARTSRARRTFVVDPTTRMEYLSSILPMATGSVDRLEEIPDRLRFLFEFDAAAALARADVVEVVEEPGARDVIVALAEELGPLGRLDRDGVSRRGQPRQTADRPEGPRAVPPGFESRSPARPAARNWTSPYLQSIAAPSCPRPPASHRLSAVGSGRRRLRPRLLGRLGARSQEPGARS